MIRAKLVLVSCCLLAGEDWVGFTHWGSGYCRAGELSDGQAACGADPSRAPSDRERGLALCKRGYEYQQQGDALRAHDVLSEAIPYLDRLPAADVEEVVICKLSLAMARRRIGRFQESYKLYRDVLTIAQKDLGPKHRLTSYGFHNLAMVESELGYLDDAQAHFTKSIELNESCCGPMNAEIIASLSQLAEIYRQRGDPVRAERVLRRALRESEKIGPESAGVATILEYLARMQYEAGALDKAEANWRRSLAIIEPVRSDNAALILARLGEMQRFKKRYRESEELLHRSVALLQTSGNLPYLAHALSVLAAVRFDRGKIDDAEVLYRRSLALAERELGPAHPQVGIVLHGLSRILVARKAYEIAEPSQRRAIEILQQYHGPKHPNLAAPLADYASLLRKLRRKGEAAEIENRIREILTKNRGTAELYTVDVRELPASQGLR